MAIHGKPLTKGVSKSRVKSISMGIEKLMKAKVIDKTAFNTDAVVTFGSEILKIATYYEAPRHGTTTTSGTKLEAAKEGAPENTLTQEILAKPKKVKTAAEVSRPDPGEFKVTKREAERAARRLASPGTTPRRVVRNMATFAALSPASSILAKGVASAAVSKGQRGRAAFKAMKGAFKDRKTLIERATGGSVVGAALSALSEGRDVRRNRAKVQKYLKGTHAPKPTVQKLKAVL